jgi:hypothetical protein
MALTTVTSKTVHPRLHHMLANSRCETGEGSPLEPFGLEGFTYSRAMAVSVKPPCLDTCCGNTNGHYCLMRACRRGA